MESKEGGSNSITSLESDERAQHHADSNVVGWSLAFRFFNQMKNDPAPFTRVILPTGEYIKDVLMYERDAVPFQELIDKQLITSSDVNPEEERPARIWKIYPLVVSKSALQDEGQMFDLFFEEFFEHNKSLGNTEMEFRLNIREALDGKEGLTLIYGSDEKKCCAHITTEMVVVFDLFKGQTPHKMFIHPMLHEPALLYQKVPVRVFRFSVDVIDI